MTRRKPKELPQRHVGSSPLEQALARIGRYLLGGYRTRVGNPERVHHSRYMPHNGKQEMDRRVRNLNRMETINGNG